jgi:hypothetical protein
MFLPKKKKLTIYNSIKEEDPLKVGRFGLGFKSVFHMTGTVLSNNLYYVTLIFISLHSVFLFDLWLLSTPLVSSKCSYQKKKNSSHGNIDITI